MIIRSSILLIIFKSGYTDSVPERGRLKHILGA